MATLKHPQTKSPVVTVPDVIYISDDERSSDSDDECDFEDVLVGESGNIREYTEATFEEITDEATDDNETTPDRLSDDDHSNDGVTDGLLPEQGGSRRREPGGIARDWDLSDDEAARMEPTNCDREGSHVVALLDTQHAILRNILVELGALRDRVAQLEARQYPCACPRSPSKKRIWVTSAGPHPKRRKNNTIVNVSATRAYVQWDNETG
ncbi:hypothetical protein ACHAQA_007659 [Verticillium albo-atrum]